MFCIIWMLWDSMARRVKWITRPKIKHSMMVMTTISIQINLIRSFFSIFFHLKMIAHPAKGYDLHI